MNNMTRTTVFQRPNRNTAGIGDNVLEKAGLASRTSENFKFLIFLNLSPASGIKSNQPE